MTATPNLERGSQRYNARLSDDAVREIRRNPRGLTAKELAAVYGVHKNVIDRVRWFMDWRHVR